MAGQKVINYNRTAFYQATPAEVAVTALIVDLKGDTSQQHRIFGIDFGVSFNANADRALLLFSALFGFLDYRGDVDAANPTVVITQAQNLGDVFYEFLNADQQQSFISVDFSNPIIINGDRRITFIFELATSGAVAANVNYALTVRGQVTQIPKEDQPKYGPYTIR